MSGERKIVEGDPQYRMYAVFSKESVNKMVNESGEFEPGKLVTQSGHCYLHAFWDAEERFPDRAAIYKKSPHAYKISLIVKDNETLLKVAEAFRQTTGVTEVVDAGFTVYAGPTLTSVCFGPISKEEADEVFKAAKIKHRLWRV